jgi:hydrogenase nickel incorporation protein HypB
MSLITIERKILEKNDGIAQKNRELLKSKKIFTINIVSSPGSGKTSLLEKTIEKLKGEINIAVIEGDVQTDLDAKRVEKYNVPVVQIVTNGGCHLDANLISDAINNINLDNIDLLVIENVGNLVCPAGYDLGEDLKVVMLSTTEGDDKPLKYPKMFRNSAVLVINKIDLLPYLSCSLSTLRNNALQINSALEIFETSCSTGDGIEKWNNFLMKKTKIQK